MGTKLIEITKKRSALDYAFLSRESYDWFQKEVKKLNSPIDLAKEIVKLRRKAPFEVGGLYTYFYDPLHKDKLPYYDTFPLVIPLSLLPDGFIGLNLHYLPPLKRALFLDKLIDFDPYSTKDQKKRIDVAYDMLKATSSMKEYKPCLKRYLNTQIRSRIIPIKTSEWETALFLPTANFVGARNAEVYRDSNKRMR